MDDKVLGTLTAHSVLLKILLTANPTLLQTCREGLTDLDGLLLATELTDRQKAEMVFAMNTVLGTGPSSPP